MSDLSSRLASSLRLEPHPEGGRYRQVHRSEATVAVEGRGVRRSALTAILFLLSRNEVSRWHRVLSDEAWHFHEGGGLELLVVDADLSALTSYRLGRASEGGEPLVVVPAGAWQAARPLGDFALASCTVGPGFEFEDFALLVDRPADAARFRQRFPDLADLL